jgi:hypothetical protein
MVKHVNSVLRIHLQAIQGHVNVLDADQEHKSIHHKLVAIYADLELSQMIGDAVNNVKVVLSQLIQELLLVKAVVVVTKLMEPRLDAQFANLVGTQAMVKLVKSVQSIVIQPHQELVNVNNVELVLKLT